MDYRFSDQQAQWRVAMFFLSSSGTSFGMIKHDAGRKFMFFNVRQAELSYNPTLFIQLSLKSPYIVY
jgi:hypothetical protein